jgi:hypothetical protein
MHRTSTLEASVRKVLVLLALAASAATVAQAQNAWQTEIGIQGGVIRSKPAGTGADDKTDFLQLPGGTFFNGIIGSPPLFAVIPWGRNKLAIEPQFGLLNVATTAAGDATVLSTVLRVDYAVSPKFYVAAGGAHTWLSANGSHDGQLGLVAAAGYRLRVTSRLNGRIEANATFRKKDDSSTPNNSYSVLAGLSSRLRGGGAARPAARGAASRSAWQAALGVQGGYLYQHVVGGALDVAGFHLPGPGNDLRQAGTPIGGPATVFAIFPLGEKLALEPGFDAHANKSAGGGDGTAITVSGRLNYAVKGGWYAAGGVSFTNINFGGASGTISGAQAAWGYRFHLTGDLGGRVEALFDVRGKNTDTATPPINGFGVLLGATMPLR